ncbi:MAG TPA: glutaredoxin family protein [Thermodesulfobacteriota bacterium]|nr:glutaredoxin family protein [Thermodesulfobacteriota bacterium]
MTKNHVDGKDKGAITLYGLSTCVWCGKTKQLLDKLGVSYDFIEVDLLQGEERAKATQAVKDLNPRCSFPTLSVNGRCIVGFDEEKITEAVGAGA